MSSVPPQGPGFVPPPPPPPPRPPYAAPPSGGLPWETKALGPEPFFETAKLFVTAPDQAWRLTRETGDFTRPLLFGVIVGWVGLVFNAVWGAMIGVPWLRYVPEQYRGYMGRAGGGIVAQVILGPLFIALGLFIGSAIFHVAFMIVGALRGSRSQFEGTFRAVSYSSIAHIAYVIPFVGGLVALVWRIYLMMLGVQQLHKTTQGKALAGILLPIALCCVCAILGIALAGAALFSAFNK
ncbi:MAG TPA: Yip1 family protein [Thermoanaerobaculia bacterium]|nr:Yip1 family protein [Thermoanaerobaculia bacterium]